MAQGFRGVGHGELSNDILSRVWPRRIRAGHSIVAFNCRLDLGRDGKSPFVLLLPSTPRFHFPCGAEHAFLDWPIHGLPKLIWIGGGLKGEFSKVASRRAARCR